MTELTDQQKRALPCYNNPGPWQDSNKIEVQRWAARQCLQRCAHRDWCAEERRSVVELIPPAIGGGSGVWAGQIWSYGDICTTVDLPRTGETGK